MQQDPKIMAANNTTNHFFLGVGQHQPDLVGHNTLEWVDHYRSDSVGQDA